MSKTLVIVESPTKSKKIQEYLGSDYEVVASRGHVLDLPEKDLGFDLETFMENFVPITKIGPNNQKTTSEETIKRLKAAAKAADKVILATDPDREGEAISWHLQNLLKIRNYERIEITEISKHGLTTAMNNARKIHIPMVEAQRARRLIDRMFGYGLSPVLSREVKDAKSAGRIQSAALHMIYAREIHNRNFISEDRFTISGALKANTFWLQSSTALYAWANEVIDEDEEDKGPEGKFVTNENPEQLFSALQSMQWKVQSIDQKEVSVSPQPPLITSSMQRAASREFGWASDVTMKYAQYLYENGYITYMRTDSVRISPEATQMGYDFIKKEYGNEYVPKTPNMFKVSGAAQNAHEAIRPVYAHKLEVTDDPEAQRLYALIHKKYIESLMAPGVNTVQTIVITNYENNVFFKGSNSAIKFDGWRRGQTLNSDEFLTLSPNDSVSFESIDIHEGKTKPLPFYNEDRLLRDLEKNQIGRPSTYATISKTLKNRNYINEDKKKNYRITALGEKAIEWFFMHGAQYIDLKYTANMEKELDDIEHHQKNRIDLLKQVRDDLKSQFNAFKEGGGMTTEKQKDLLHKIKHEGFDVPDEAFEEMSVAKTIIDNYMNNKPPSLKQREFAEKLAANLGITLEDDILNSMVKTSAFIDAQMKNAPVRQAPPASEKQIAMAKNLCESQGKKYDPKHESSIESMSSYINTLMQSNERPPSDAQIKFAENIAAKKGLKYTAEMKKSMTKTKEFIDKNK